jgi:transposase InsO family protein
VPLPGGDQDRQRPPTALDAQLQLAAQPTAAAPQSLILRLCASPLRSACTGIRCPTTTGKIERFHKTLRAELLTGRRFPSLALAQQAVDAWVENDNTQRPHQAIAMPVPANGSGRPRPEPPWRLDHRPSLPAQPPSVPPR